MTRVYLGTDTLANIQSIVADRDPQSILIVRGGTSYVSSGAQEAIEPQLSGRRISYYQSQGELPTIEDVQSAIRVIRENSVDFIIGVGGGKPMDIAKSASLLHKKDDLEAYVTGQKKAEGENIARLLIPTTAGSGAEITPFSVVYIGTKKYSLAHPSMAPDYVILAPELTYSMSPHLTAATGCDALSQAIEAFWSKNATEDSREYSRVAIPIVLKHLGKAVNDPDPASRDQMLTAAHYAGQAIAIAKTTAAHALSYPFTAHHGISHGHAVMLTLPEFFPINENPTQETIQEGLEIEDVKATYAELLDLLGVKDGVEAKELLQGLMDDIGLERNLGKLDVGPQDIARIKAEGFNKQRAANNPVIVTADTVTQVLEAIS